ncbi:MAG: Maf family protein [Alphaproteobacteria bacterium]|nr:Maf family protein [Alphaproteobacteria bacterium]
MTSNPSLVLASKSHARQAMLKNAGLCFDLAPAAIDEHKIIETLQGEGKDVGEIAKELAQKKALSIASLHADRLVIGSDQTLDFEEQLMTKACDEESALEKLKILRGKTHTLISAVAVAKGDQILWSASDQASLTMHDLDDEFLAAYCKEAGDALVNCVGAYEYERAGAWLFSNVKGDYFTILGMPLLPLLAYLREHHGARP